MLERIRHCDRQGLAPFKRESRRRLDVVGCQRRPECLALLCLKYLPQESIAPWLRSVLAIPSPHWRAQMMSWMVGAHDMLTDALRWPSQLPEQAAPSVAWEWSHCLHPELAMADDSGAFRSIPCCRKDAACKPCTRCAPGSATTFIRSGSPVSRACPIWRRNWAKYQSASRICMLAGRASQRDAKPTGGPDWLVAVLQWPLYWAVFLLIPSVRKSCMNCRDHCGACCTAPSITSPIPGMPNGKPAGVRCVQLDEDNRCRVFGKPERPAFCGGLQPSEEMCGTTASRRLSGSMNWNGRRRRTRT